MFKTSRLAEKPLTVDRPVDRFSKISDRWLTLVDRPVDRPKLRVWVCQSVDHSVDRNGVRLTARSTGKRAHMHTPWIRTAVDRAINRSDLKQSRSTARSTVTGQKLKNRFEI